MADFKIQDGRHAVVCESGSYQKWTAYGISKLPHYKARTGRRNWTELNWHGLVFDEPIYSPKVDAYLSVVRKTPTLLDGAYCNALLLAHWSVCQKLNQVSTVQLRRSVLVFRFTKAHSRQNGRQKHQPFARPPVWPVLKAWAIMGLYRFAAIALTCLEVSRISASISTPNPTWNAVAALFRFP